MEALWNLEDKFKLSTQKSLLLFVCTVLSVIGLCATTSKLKKKRFEGKQLMDEEQPRVVDMVRNINSSESSSTRGSIRKALVGYMRWSGGCKWEDTKSGRRKNAPPLLPTSIGSCKVELGWQSRNLGEPVWQRPILMGEKCELPRFSGLILYDEQGRPLHHHSDTRIVDQEKTVTVVTTLRDLL